MKAKIWFATATATSLVLASAGTAWAVADTTAPVVNSVDLPTGQVGPQFVARANVTDDQSGVGKVYLYIDDSNGRHVSGIQLWDDATHSDSMAFDNTYSAAITLGLNAGTYRVSILTLDSKYNELKKPVASVVVTGQSYTWSPVTATPPPTPTPTPVPTPTPTPTPMPSQPSSDTAPPTVTDVSLPASTTATSTASAVVRDPGSGVNKVYVYVDRADGTNAAGIRLWDDGTNSDPIAADSRYTGTSTLNLPNGTYNVSVLTYDAKYNETKPRVGSLVVAGTTYTWRSSGSTPTPAPTPTPVPTPTPTPNPTPTYPPLGTNLLANGSFEAGLAGWQTRGGTATAGEAFAGTRAAQLDATASADARVEQVVTGLRPKTLYTFALRIRTTGSQPSDVWASWGATNGPQLDKTGSAQSPLYAEQRLTFTTGENATSVNIWAQAGRNDPAGRVWVDDLRVVEGQLPAPSADFGQPAFPEPPALVTLPSPGQNLILNGTFSNGTKNWVTDYSTITNAATNPVMRISSGPTRTGRIVQDIAPMLAPNTDYTLTARARVGSGDGTVAFSSKDGSVNASRVVTSTAWQPVSIPFRTGAGYTTGRLIAENWKGDEAYLEVDDLEIRAKGGEWLDTPNPVPTAKPTFFEDFSSPTLDKNKWLIANKAWGGANGGVVPENVSIANGVAKLQANGDRYTGSVNGLGGRKTRVGSSLVTRDYYASGKYEVRAKVPRTLGACTAFWSYHYIEYTPSQPEYWQEPNRIRNSEIDWEFPTAADDGSPNDGVTFDKARANSWGGKFGGEGGNVSLRPNIGQLIGDGNFHTYTYEWHSGAATTTPYIAWSIDGIQVARYTGATYGQDNVPFRASRFWLGIWFPASGYKDLVGWAGNPDFDKTTLELDWVRITPFNEANDRYEAETWPNGFYASPDQYPKP